MQNRPVKARNLHQNQTLCAAIRLNWLCGEWAATNKDRADSTNTEALDQGRLWWVETKEMKEISNLNITVSACIKIFLGGKESRVTTGAQDIMHGPATTLQWLNPFPVINLLNLSFIPFVKYKCFNPNLKVGAAPTTDEPDKQL